MKPERLVQHLSDALRKVGYRVRSEEGNFRGGSCVCAEERMVILNRRMTQEERAELLGRVAADENLDGVFLLPEVRAFIERFQSRSELGAGGEPVPPETPPAESETLSPPEA